MTVEYRGKRNCVFGDGGESAGDWCNWNSEMYKKLQSNSSSMADPYDRLELCKLCVEQNAMKISSNIGSNTRNLVENTQSLVEVTRSK